MTSHAAAMSEFWSSCQSGFSDPLWNFHLRHIPIVMIKEPFPGLFGRQICQKDKGLFPRVSETGLVRRTVGANRFRSDNDQAGETSM
jgi:hypothetical protein